MIYFWKKIKTNGVGEPPKPKDREKRNKKENLTQTQQSFERRQASRMDLQIKFKRNPKFWWHIKCTIRSFIGLK